MLLPRSRIIPPMPKRTKQKKSKAVKNNKTNLNFKPVLVSLISLLIIGLSLVFLISKIQFKSKAVDKPLSTVSPTVPTELKPIKVSTNAAIIVPQPIPQVSGNTINIPILTYHYIGNNPNPLDKIRDNLSVSPNEFEVQMKYIAENGFNTTSLDTMYASLEGKATLPAKSIILTFDDGYIDFYVNAFPILRRFNLHATAFIPTALINQGYYMSWDQIKEIDATGLISFQAHTVYHPDLTSLNTGQAMGEISTSKRVLEQQLGKPVNFLAYPYGVSNLTTWQLVKQAGFMGAVGTWTGKTHSQENMFNMPRVKIPGGITLEQFATMIN